MCCPWCHNPEGLHKEPELMIFPGKCIGCAECAKVCTKKAIEIMNGGILTHRDQCEVCFECVKVCPSGARTIVGRYVTPQELVREVERDRIFYEKSGGGVTVSGGEGTFQPKFISKFLSLCKKINIHTALDTCGYTQWEPLKDILSFVDLVLLDLKIMDSEKHKQILKVSNEPILGNAKRMDKMGKRIIVRVPLIPGYTDDEVNGRRIGEFVKSLKSVEKVDLLPFHRMGESKYRQLGKNYLLSNVKPLDDDRILEIMELLESYGLKIEIPGRQRNSNYLHQRESK